METSAQPYPLGQSADEHRRLMIQAQFYGELSEEILRHAGLGPGMKVLDLGCGAGDVSLLAAKLVGPTGAVVGIDRADEPLAIARRRAAAAGVDNVRFEKADGGSYESAEIFDALVGRFVLMYLPDPAAGLRRLAEKVRPGGVIVMQEMMQSVTQATPAVPLASRCIEWIKQTMRCAGVAPDFGLRLPTVFRAAGLPMPAIRLYGRMEGHADSGVFDVLAGTVRSLLPMMERFAIVRPGEVDPTTLADRLRAELLAAGAMALPPLIVAASTRVPMSA